MRMEDIHVEVRDASLRRLGTVSLREAKLLLRPVFNNVGEWEMELPIENPMCDELRKPGSGIVVTGPGPGGNGRAVFLSGPMTYSSSKASSAEPTGMMTFKGITDDHHLRDRLAYPVPGDPTMAGQQAKANDKRTGPVESVMHAFVNANVGPDSPASRRINELRMGTDLGRGPTVQKSARFKVLGNLLLEAAPLAKLGFRVVQVGSKLEFQTFEQADKRKLIRFDLWNNTLASYQVEQAGAQTTHVIVAGQEEGVDRQLFEVTSEESLEQADIWHRRIETFLDQRQTDDVAELTQAGDELLAKSGIAQYGVKFTPMDEYTMRYLYDWSLGDIVTAVVEGREVSAVVAEAIIKIDKDGVRIAAALGDQTSTGNAINTVDMRLEALEKNVAVMTNRSYAATKDTANTAKEDAGQAKEDANQAKEDAAAAKEQADYLAGLTDQLDQNIVDVSTALDAVKTTVDQVDADMGSVSLRMDQVDSDLASANAELDALGTTVTGVESDLSEVRVTANGKNSITYSTTDPTGSPKALGDMWFKTSGDRIIGQWVGGSAGGAWHPRKLENSVIANLDAGKINAGFLDAARIKARTITADKVVIADGQNLVPNGMFETGTTELWDPILIQDAADAAPGQPFSMKTPAGRGTAGGVINSLDTAGFDVDPDAEYLFEIWVKADKPNSRIFIEIRDQNGEHAAVWSAVDGTTFGGNAAYPVADYTLPTTWTKLTARGVFKAGVTRARFASFYYNHANGSERGAVQYIGGVRLRRRSEGQLLVDGSITAAKLVTNAVTADKLAANAVTADKILAGSVSAAKLAANAVTASKIAANAVTAGKIAADAITADKLAAGSIDGKVITGATIRTAVAGDRVELTPEGLEVIGGKMVMNSDGYIESNGSDSQARLGDASLLLKRDIDSEWASITTTSWQYGTGVESRLAIRPSGPKGVVTIGDAGVVNLFSATDENVGLAGTSELWIGTDVALVAYHDDYGPGAGIYANDKSTRISHETGPIILDAPDVEVNGQSIPEYVEDTGWITLPLSDSTNFEVYSSGSEPRVRRIGKLVELRGCLAQKTPEWIDGSEREMFVIPAGMRPSGYYISHLCQGSSENYWHMIVDTGGPVKAGRYGPAKPTSSRTWMPFQVTWFID